MKKSPSSKPKKKHRVRGPLCVAFAAATLLSGCGLFGQHNQQTYPNGTEPSIVQVFNASASQSDPSNNPFGGQWNAMLQHESHYMAIAKDAQAYKNYLAQYNNLKGESLDQMAVDVNNTVENQTTYTSDPALYHAADYWAAPIETSMYNRGDCEDYAILQFYILRHLGVPEDRLFVAVVNAEGDTSAPDHAILLLNDAPAGQPEHFIVLNDGGPVVNAADFNHAGIVPETPDGPYILFEAMNNAAYWQVQNTGSATSAVSANQKTAQKVAVSAPPGLPPMVIKLG